MTNNARLSIKAMILYGLAIIAVAFIGVVAGNWFVQWRQERPIEVSLETWAIHNQSMLQKGDIFPDEHLLNMDGDTVMAASMYGGRKNLVLFIATGCEACGMAIESWKDEVAGLPDDVFIWGIGVGSVEGLRAYKEETGFPFPLYCDIDLLYPQQYDLATFPSVVGLNEDGRVDMIMQGYSHEYDLKDYCEYLSKVGAETAAESEDEG